MHFSVEFRPSESPDVFLARAFKPFLEQYIWPSQRVPGFFPGINRRMVPSYAYVCAATMPGLTSCLNLPSRGWMRDRGEWKEVSYVPDASLYGGDEVLV
jgi:hypothetical protein